MANQPEGNGAVCATCGLELKPEARFCTNCGAATDPATSGRVVHQRGPVLQPAYAPNHLVEAILVTICCCVPTGIVAIAYAAQVNSKLAAGDYAGAVRDSNSAKTWCYVSLVLGIIVGIVGGAIILAGG